MVAAARWLRRSDHAEQGAGLTRFPHAHHERVVELDRPNRAACRHGATSDPLDATRAARKALGRDTSPSRAPQANERPCRCD